MTEIYSIRKPDMVSLIWLGFVLFILMMLALDLGVFHRGDRAIPPQEALAWTGFWVALALAFNVLIYFMYEGHWLGIGIIDSTLMSGREAALQYFTGYLIEKSLSLDNIFVIALLFVYFKVSLEFQHRVLYWGVIGALVMRGGMILLGATLISHFSWSIYVFGALLLISAVRLLIARHDNLEIESNPLVKLARKFLPITSEYKGSRFLIRNDGKLSATPLFLVLLVIEGTDLLFAVDSIPAIFAITKDPFIVFTSNVFAILGLRSLYFALAGLMTKFRYMKMSLVFVVAFVGISMLLSHHYPIPTLVSLIIILGILSVGIAASLLAANRDTAALLSPLAEDLEDLAKLTLVNVWKIIVLVIGSTILLVGIAMLVLPGPGILTTLLGLSILAPQFVWARRLLQKVKDEVGRIENRILHVISKKK